MSAVWDSSEIRHVTSLLYEKCLLTLLVRRNLDSSFNHSSPNLCVRGELSTTGIRFVFGHSLLDILLPPASGLFSDIHCWTFFHYRHQVCFRTFIVGHSSTTGIRFVFGHSLLDILPLTASVLFSDIHCFATFIF